MVAQLSNFYRRQQGFTLLEMLIVIVIIGILAVIIVPGLSSGPQRARDAQRKADVRGVKNALETYYNDNSSYPASGGTTSVLRYTSLATPLVTSYLSAMPTDPKSGGIAYQYLPKDATATSAAVFACLENSVDAGTGTTASYTGVIVVASMSTCTGSQSKLYLIQTIN